MGCTASQGAPAVQENGGGNNEGKMMFPLSMYQKSLIQETWEDVEKELVTFGVGIFYRYVDPFASQSIEEGSEVRKVRSGGRKTGR